MYVPVRAFVENHYKKSLNEGRTQWCKLSPKKPYDPASCERKKELEKERQMVLWWNASGLPWVVQKNQYLVLGHDARTEHKCSPAHPTHSVKKYSTAQIYFDYAHAFHKLKRKVVRRTSTIFTRARTKKMRDSCHSLLYVSFVLQCYAKIFYAYFFFIRTHKRFLACFMCIFWLKYIRAVLYNPCTYCSTVD